MARGITPISGSRWAGSSSTYGISPCATPGGAYLGTLEVTQDLAPIRALTGERRLLSD